MSLTGELDELWERHILLQGVEAGSWTWKGQWNVRSGDVGGGKEENIPSRGNCTERGMGLGNSGTFKA